MRKAVTIALTNTNTFNMRFNFLKRREKTVTNYEGAKAHAMTPESELYAAVVTASLSDNFYEKAGDRLARIGELMAKTDATYVAKLAVYSRTQMNMRCVPLVLAVELAKRNSGNAVVSKAVSGVVKRADEITELLAYYQVANKRDGLKKLNKLSKQLQKGLASSFNNFDEYQFAKYNRDTEVQLRDALFLVHPKARDEAQQELFNKIAANTLATPYTWETELSALGQAAYETKEQRAAAITTKWEELIDSNRLGYMAMLRNLRNMIQSNVSYGHIRKVCGYLADKNAVANSKQLPFRFLAAFREISVERSEYVTLVQ
jgi:60 kDa SS-A/Ro ribonucleoprotein